MLMGTTVSSQNGLDPQTSRQLIESMVKDRQSSMETLQRDRESSDKRFSQMFSDVTSFMRTTVMSMQETQQQMQRMMTLQSSDYFSSMARITPRLY